MRAESRRWIEGWAGYGKAGSRALRRHPGESRDPFAAPSQQGRI